MKKARVRPDRNVLADIDRGEFRPVYLLVAEDQGLADEVVGRLRAALVEPGLESFDLEQLSADELDLSEARQKLRQLPVGPRRLVVISGLTRQGASGPIFSELGRNGTAELCRELALVEPPIHVAVTALPKKELGPILAETGLRQSLVTLQSPQAGDLLALVQKWAAGQGLALDPDAARLLVNIAGDSTGTIKSEIEKLATACPKGRVTAKEVRDLAGSSREFELKDYVDRVLNRDPASAVAVLRRLEAWGEDTPRIMTWLTTALLDLVAVKAGAATSFQAWRLAGADRNWSGIEEVNLCLQQLYKTTRAKMTGQPQDFARLELLTFCVACRARLPGCQLAESAGEHGLCMRSRPHRRRGAA